MLILIQVYEYEYTYSVSLMNILIKNWKDTK